MSPRTSNLIWVMPAKEARSGQGAPFPLHHRPGVGGRTGGGDVADPRDPARCQGLGGCTLLEAAVGAGVDAIQIRAKEATDRALFDLTTMVVDRLRLLGATVIVNGRLDVALRAGTDGGHLGLADLHRPPGSPPGPQGFLVGATCRNEQHARQARDEGGRLPWRRTGLRDRHQAGTPRPRRP